MNLKYIILYYIMCLRSRSDVKVSMFLTRATHYCIHNYIRSLLNIIC